MLVAVVVWRVLDAMEIVQCEVDLGAQEEEQEKVVGERGGLDLTFFSVLGGTWRWTFWAHSDCSRVIPSARLWQYRCSHASSNRL